MSRKVKLPCRLLIAFLAITFTLTIQAKAEHSEPPPEITALRITGTPPTIDGSLDDSIWSNSQLDIQSKFTMLLPDEGKPQSESTLVAVAYDDDALYIAFWCYDSEPDKMVQRLVRRDRFTESDRVVFLVDPYHDHLTGFRFEVFAANVQRDWRSFDDENLDQAWDGVWESGTKIHSWGWTAEMKIPYHCLRFKNEEEQVWGVNFQRRISRKQEHDFWAYRPESEGGVVSKYGHLKGIKSIKPARHLEVLPYSVANFETEPKSIGNENGRDLFGNIGMDVKYGITSNLTMDLTVNPDFGQVELDEPVLNLSTFETYFSEKRPFFIEGSSLFNTNYTLFYSRRIGRSPRFGIDDDDFSEYTSYPKATTILGAAKLTGKIAEHTSIGLLSAVTDEETAEYITESDLIKSGIVEPTANYNVFRIKQDIMGTSSIGGMLTTASQDKVHPSVTGGIDYRLKFLNDTWQVNGQGVFSRNDPDVTGYGMDFNLEKTAGENIRGAVGLEFKEDLNLNRLGFSGREDYKGGWCWWQYRTNSVHGILNKTWNNINYGTGYNVDGFNINHYANYNFSFEFINYWTLNGGIDFEWAKYDDRETRGYDLWEAPFGWSWWASMSTDPRKNVTLILNPGSGKNRNGTWWAHYTGVEVRPKSNVELSAGVNILQNRNQTRWVENTFDDNDNLKEMVFADLNKDEVQISFTLGYVPKSNLSVQLSAQGVIAALDYTNYRQYLGGENYGEVEGDFDHDYNWSALNTMLLVRWEYQPGSTLYLVWTRVRSEFDDQSNNLDFNRDFDRFFSAGANNVFLVKLSYWMNL